MSSLAPPYFEMRELQAPHLQCLKDIESYLASLSLDEEYLPTVHEDWCACLLLHNMHFPPGCEWIEHQVMHYIDENFHHRRKLHMWKKFLGDVRHFLIQAERSSCHNRTPL